MNLHLGLVLGFDGERATHQGGSGQERDAAGGLVLQRGAVGGDGQARLLVAAGPSQLQHGRHSLGRAEAVVAVQSQARVHPVKRHLK